jgi:hypothetical protein
MKKMICFSLFIFALIAGNAQDKFFFRADFGLTHPIVSSNLDNLSGDFNPHHRLVSGYDAIGGFYIGHSLYHNFNIELGVNYQSFSDRYTIKFPDTWESGSLGAIQTCIIIPLNVSYNWNLLNSKLFIVPYFGVSYASRLKDHNFATLIITDTLEILTDTVTTIPTRPSDKYSFLFNTGIGIEYRVSDRLGITLNGNYSIGLNEIHRFNVQIKQAYRDDIIGKLSYKGTHYYIAFGIKIYI